MIGPHILLFKKHLYGKFRESYTFSVGKMPAVKRLRKKDTVTNELQEVVVTKSTISTPLRRDHNSGNLEEHELQELKPRKVVNLRPLPPLPSSPPIVTGPTRFTSTPQKGTELPLFAI